jgi:hypothetical protein
VLARKRLQAVQKRVSETEAELQAHEFDLGGMLTPSPSSAGRS